jgi:lauroyl/myristoyl acyltransferase
MTLVQVLPWKVSFAFLWIVSWLYLLANGEDKEIIRNNLEQVFGRNLADEEMDILFRLTVRGIFNHYFEKLFLACSSDQEWKAYFRQTIRISGKRSLDRFLAKGKGLILVTAHFGAVEFLPGFLTLLGYRVAIIAKFKTQRLREKCEERARSVGAKIIDANEKNSLFWALSALGEGRILITQCDEVECWRPYPGRSVSLFGTSFQVDRILGILQKRSGAPMVFAYVRREENGGYATEIEDICGPEGELPGRLEETILKKLERLVYTHPDQWYIWKNFHRMQATEGEEIAVENRKCRNLPVAPASFATYYPPYSLPAPHGQYCPQASL